MTMTVWYSDHLGADGVSDIALQVPAPRLDPWKSHGRVRRKRAAFEGLPLAGDVVRLMSFSSSDHIWNLLVSSDGGSAAGAADLGIYHAGNPSSRPHLHNGAVVDADLFGSAIDLSVPLDMVDQWSESTVTSPLSRGLPLWQTVSASAGVADLSADPKVIYDLCLTVTTSFTTANTKLVFVVDFISAGAGD
jgi:hypothetical protein